jgi:hypothetical protein
VQVHHIVVFQLLYNVSLTVYLKVIELLFLIDKGTVIFFCRNKVEFICRMIVKIENFSFIVIKQLKLTFFSKNKFHHCLFSTNKN